MTPPTANKEPFIANEHGHIRKDPYHWLNQRDNFAVLEYLKAENVYTDIKMAHTSKLQNELYEEFKNRIKENDSSVPYKDGLYYYYTRYEENKAHPIYCRKKNNLDSPEEIILDINVLAKNHDYYSVANLKISPNNQWLAFAEDTQGRRKYTIQIKNLITGQYLESRPINASNSFEWANDSNTLFYIRLDNESLRAYQVYRHQLNKAGEEDKRVYEEKDVTYHLDLSKSKSQQYLMIESLNKNSSEIQIVDAYHPDDAFRIFSPRVEGREYYIEHHKNKFYIKTNDNAPNFKVMHCGLNDTSFQHWQPFLHYNPDIYLESFSIFENYLVLEEREKGLTRIKVHPFTEQAPYYIEFDDPTYMVWVVNTPEMSSPEVRFVFSSLKQPKSVYDFNMQTKHKTLKKQEEILGGFSSNNYHVERIFAKAEDGVSIPISLVYRTSMFKASQNPLLLLGYGSYGVTYDAGFNSFIISLLDRGFVVAIAHVRGGSDLGREWYHQGKLLNKKNTFYDFIAAAEHLKLSGYAAPNKLYGMGTSAGGLLISAVMNMRPELFNGMIAEVPFVDLINTMMDPNIPLTTSEYAEWGDPSNQTFYDYMLSYSPYDNVHATSYPNLLVIAAYHDSQVQYWESAKWVAKLRELKTDNHLLLLRTLMNASHGGASGRYEKYREKAFEYAFLLGLEQ